MATFANFAVFDNFWQHLETCVILLSCHPVILSSCHIVILTSYHYVLLSSWKSGSLSIFQLVNLLACEILSL